MRVRGREDERHPDACAGEGPHERGGAAREDCIHMLMRVGGGAAREDADGLDALARPVSVALNVRRHREHVLRPAPRARKLSCAFLSRC
jgi:hypothetical protein